MLGDKKFAFDGTGNVYFKYDGVSEYAQYYIAGDKRMEM